MPDGSTRSTRSATASLRATSRVSPSRSSSPERRRRVKPSVVFTDTTLLGKWMPASGATARTAVSSSASTNFPGSSWTLFATQIRASSGRAVRSTRAITRPRRETPNVDARGVEVEAEQARPVAVAQRPLHLPLDAGAGTRHLDRPDGEERGLARHKDREKYAAEHGEGHEERAAGREQGAELEAITGSRTRERDDDARRSRMRPLGAPRSSPSGHRRLFLRPAAVSSAQPGSPTSPTSTTSRSSSTPNRSRA